MAINGSQKQRSVDAKRILDLERQVCLLFGRRSFVCIVWLFEQFSGVFVLSSFALFHIYFVFGASSIESIHD